MEKQKLMKEECDCGGECTCGERTKISKDKKGHECVCGLNGKCN